MHVSVLLAETVGALNLRPDGVYVDATGGAGGHSAELLKSLGPNGRLWVNDQDPQAVEALEKKFAGDGRVQVLRSKFSELFHNLKERGVSQIDGLMADLGFSSTQMDDGARGLSFMADGPLDMRLDPSTGSTAADLVNELPEKELADLFYKLGEERHSRKIARAIAYDRQEKTFETTRDLAGLAERVLGPLYRRQKIHPATRLFMALRIAVNRELEELEALLEGLEGMMAPGGRVALISFHSLEDRIVKRKFATWGMGDWKRVTKKPLIPTEDEMRSNPRSRSAKLRVIEKV